MLDIVTIFGRCLSGRAVVQRAMLLLSLILSGCTSTPQFQSGYDPQFDFSAIESYAFLPRRDALIDDRLTTGLIMQRIEIAVENELAARQWQMLGRQQADIWVSYFVTSEPDNSLAAYRYYHGYQPCWDCSGHKGEPEINIGRRGDRQTALVVDIVNPVSRQLVWRGVVSKAIKKADSQELKQMMAEVVNLLMLDFPPVQQELKPDVGK